MNKTFAIYLLFFGLITYVYADDVLVKVGGPNGENIFDPQTAYAKVGDKIIFKWISGAHNVIESNLTGSCIKSSEPNAFASNGIFEAPNTMTVQINVTEEIWFYCGVSTHCRGGMYGTIKISPNSIIPNNPIKATTNNTNNTPIIVGEAIGLLTGVSLLTAVSYFLYKRFNKNNIILIPDNNRNNYHDSKQINKSENQDTEKVYNPGQEAVSISENTKVYNHGQETIPISENDALQNYIVQIVRKEMMQNQKENSSNEVYQ
ncbi:hypothetical protein RhiirA5_410911 [Rhizophagus irregularis]|uniref:Phytocyanin domain-containing protein n=1 Tax=Rhizophagus irregularis TaxID=588596 RepID=A0A2I1ESP7_9GLOM|nr:hypothetical protein RhiirA5_410911 [Rhizophagus irregularis]PKY25095.1 hypothetical protein RhiirB3_439893 [Rhizophagus irregularis]CAB5215495.1 unnamed protein product [Rhizophagus irregularis]CAB5342768.1 unnamed protein product [Rhizophagus irregularis]